MVFVASSCEKDMYIYTHTYTCTYSHTHTHTHTHTLNFSLNHTTHTHITTDKATFHSVGHKTIASRVTKIDRASDAI